MNLFCSQTPLLAPKTSSSENMNLANGVKVLSNVSETSTSQVSLSPLLTDATPMVMKPNPLFAAQKPLIMKTNPLLAAQKPLLMKPNPLLAAQKLLMVNMKRNDVTQPVSVIPLIATVDNSRNEVKKRVELTPVPKPPVSTKARKLKYPIKIFRVPNIHLKLDPSLVKQPSAIGLRLGSQDPIYEKHPKFFHHSEIWPVLTNHFSGTVFKFNTPSPDTVIRAGLANQPVGYQVQAQLSH